MVEAADRLIEPRLTILEMVARLHPVAPCTCDHDIPDASTRAIPAGCLTPH
jgi:hypothetical protein